MRLRLTLAVTLLPLALPAQQKRPITFADLQALKRVSDPQISPSGKWVLFSVTDVSLEKNSKVNHLWVVPVAGGKEMQVTFSTGESNGRFSPNGQFVMFTGAPNDTDAVSRIAIASWDEATGKLGVARTMNAVSGDADGAIWSPDSRHFLFTTGVYPECSDKPTWPEEDACDKSKDDAAAKSPVKAQVWDHLLYRHWNAYTGEKRSHIILADFSMDGANPRDLTPRSVVGDAETPTFSLGGPLGYAWAPDSKEIAYVVNLDKVPAESTNNDIFTLQLGAEPSTAKKVSTSPGSDDGPQYSPDGKYLAWRSQARAGFESDKFRLMEMDRATGKITNVLANFDGWVDEFVYARRHDSENGKDGYDRFFYITSSVKGEEPILVGPERLVRPVSKAQPPSAEIPPPPPPPPTAFAVYGATANGSKMPTTGEYSNLQISADAKWLVAVRMTVDKPSEIVVHMASYCDRAEIGCVMGAAPGQFAGGQITHLNDDLLSNLALSPLESFTFPGANGTKVEGFLIRPPNFDPSKKYPLKFLIHGGPQGAWGDSWSFRWNPELFAANGYVVVMINPRGSTGYGQQFVDEVSGDWGGRPYIDLMKGLDYAEKTYPFIDKTRECALGASYGGYMANWILTHTTRFACIVTHDGMFNPKSAFGSTEELWFNEWEFRPLVGTGPDAVVDQTHPAHPWGYLGKDPAEDPFRKFAPMQYIENAKTPTLVIHSQNDYRLDVSEGFQLFTALQLLHVPSKMLYFPDEGHWVMKPQNSQLWYTTVNDWVDQWTHTNAYVPK
jgi:dipeptidyl aminopeptidase/acylaminoacyl peptidase